MIVCFIVNIGKKPGNFLQFIKFAKVITAKVLLCDTIINSFMCVCVQVCASVHMCMCVCMSVCEYVCVCVCVCVCV